MSEIKSGSDLIFGALQDKASYKHKIFRLNTELFHQFKRTLRSVLEEIEERILLIQLEGGSIREMQRLLAGIPLRTLGDRQQRLVRYATTFERFNSSG